MQLRFYRYEYWQAGEFKRPEKEESPWNLSQEGALLLGHARIYLQSAFFLMPVSVDTPIIDYTGAQKGHMKVG
jgi:hypothetical protein